MTRTSHQAVHGHGAVVLAAYQPDAELFATQLRTIQAQTYREFVCLVGADGGVDGVRAVVKSVVGPDDRFVVVGWEDNVGFYLNFERLLQAVPAESRWVALSDHDDRWHEDKLARLLPRLGEHALVSGQARVVTAKDGSVLLPSTDRRVVPPEALLLQNQVTGSLCVFRRELLDLALPFPRFHTITQLHDHWLAMCAAAVDGYEVLDVVVQDYVQHDANVIGEIATTQRRWTPTLVLRRVRELALHYEGGTSPRQCIRAAQQLSYGWRRAMVAALDARAHPRPIWLSQQRQWLCGSRWGAVRLLLSGFRSRNVLNSVVATFVAGLPGEFWWRSPAPKSPCTTETLGGWANSTSDTQATFGRGDD